MRTTLGKLRRLIREFGLDTDMRNMAGTCGGMGANANHRDREALVNPPPALGSPEEQQDDMLGTDKEPKNQPGVRVADRAGTTGSAPKRLKLT